MLYASLQSRRGPAKRLLTFDTWLAMLRKLELMQADVSASLCSLAYLSLPEPQLTSTHTSSYPPFHLR